MSLSKSALKKIMLDIKELEKHPLDNEGIYFHHDPANVSNGIALIFGPEDTPYAHGAYLFEFTFPEDYPFKPPVVKFCTGDGSTRFHPNLYIGGKVCLSLLNTWQGPSWSPINSISSILITMISILNNDPLLNEPGYENYNKDKEIYTIYSNCVRYKNCSHVIITQTQDIKPKFKYFENIIEKYYLKNADNINKMLQTYNKNNSGTFYNKTYSLEVTTNYKLVINMFNQMIDSLQTKHTNNLTDPILTTNTTTTNTTVTNTTSTNTTATTNPGKKLIKIIKKNPDNNTDVGQKEKKHSDELEKKKKVIFISKKLKQIK